MLAHARGSMCVADGHAARGSAIYIGRADFKRPAPGLVQKASRKQGRRRRSGHRGTQQAAGPSAQYTGEISISCRSDPESGGTEHPPVPRSAFKCAQPFFRPTPAIFTVPGASREIGLPDPLQSRLLPRRSTPLLAREINPWKSASSRGTFVQAAPIRPGPNSHRAGRSEPWRRSLEPLPGFGELTLRPWLTTMVRFL